MRPQRRLLLRAQWCRPRDRSGGGLPVHRGFGQLCQLVVGHIFLIEILLQKRGAIGAAELLCPGLQRAVAGDLVMLHRLGGGDDGRIEDLLVRDLACNLVGLLQNAVDRGAVDRLRLGAMQLEDLLQPLDMAIGLPAMRFQRPP